MSSRRRVLIDAERLKYPNSGLGQFALHLGRELLRTQRDTWTPVFLVPKGSGAVFGELVEYEETSWTLKLLSTSTHFDLWHATHQDSAYRPPSDTPYILTIHDLNFLHEKSESKAQSRLARLQRKVDGAAALTAISEYTGAQIRGHLHLPDIPLRVIYNGLCAQPDEVAIRPTSVPEGEFLFALGVVRPKKNFHVLVDFVVRLPGRNLIIAGNDDHPYAGEILDLSRKLGVEDRVVLLGEVGNEEKTWLYKHCEAFVFPSLLEGFGLPVVEAMSFGKPVFCSRLTSLPEIGGPDVFYWEDFDPDNMIDLYTKVMPDAAHDEERAERLRQRAQSFSWQNAAREYANFYEEMLEKRLG